MTPWKFSKTMWEMTRDKAKARGFELVRGTYCGGSAKIRTVYLDWEYDSAEILLKRMTLASSLLAESAESDLSIYTDFGYPAKTFALCQSRL